MAADIPYYTLNDGAKMPSVGIGCWMGEYGGGEKCEQTVKLALKNGYRHIDTAFGYGNEEAVGKAIRESGIPRKELFVVTKLIGKHHGCVREGFQISLKALDVEYIDLYLMHYPQAYNEKGEAFQPDESPTFVETWLEMEKLLETGKVKSIGVSNFSIKTLEVLLPKANVVPATNQVELHPCLPQFELRKYCEERGILLTAYSPLGQPAEDNMQSFDESVVTEVAQRTNSSKGQILVSWAVQHCVAVVPKSENEGRMKQNITLIKLSDADMRALDEIHLKPGMHRTLLHRYHKGVMAFGWTYDQYGWNMREGGYVGKL